MIGKEEEPITGKVYEKELRRFCYAVGDLNPIYLDEEEAKRSNHAGIVAPPMFYDIPTMREFPLDELKNDGMPKTVLNLPLKASRAMAGGKEVEFFKPMGQFIRIQILTLDVLLELNFKLGNIIGFIQHNYRHGFPSKFF